MHLYLKWLLISPESIFSALCIQSNKLRLLKFGWCDEKRYQAFSGTTALLNCLKTHRSNSPEAFLLPPKSTSRYSFQLNLSISRCSTTSAEKSWKKAFLSRSWNQWVKLYILCVPPTPRYWRKNIFVVIKIKYTQGVVAKFWHCQQWIYPFDVIRSPISHQNDSLLRTALYSFYTALCEAQQNENV